MHTMVDMWGEGGGWDGYIVKKVRNNSACFVDFKII